MQGYKASYNSICSGFKYEVGRTYKLDGELKMCENGFHFCKKMEDVLVHYSPAKDFVLFEVEVLGEIITEHGKSCTDEIKIVRIIPVEEHKLFEINGNTLHFKRGDIDRWIDYDERGNVIHLKCSTGYERWMSYNAMNKLIYFKNCEGLEQWVMRDKDGNMIFRETNNGKEFWYNTSGYRIKKPTISFVKT